MRSIVSCFGNIEIPEDTSDILRECVFAGEILRKTEEECTACTGKHGVYLIRYSDPKGDVRYAVEEDSEAYDEIDDTDNQAEAEAYYEDQAYRCVSENDFKDTWETDIPKIRREMEEAENGEPGWGEHERITAKRPLKASDMTSEITDELWSTIVDLVMPSEEGDVRDLSMEQVELLEYNVRKLNARFANGSSPRAIEIPGRPLTSYVHAIEADGGDAGWQVAEVGYEKGTTDTPREYGDAVLANWLDDQQNNGVATDGWRVRVWRGTSFTKQSARPDYTVTS